MALGVAYMLVLGGLAVLGGHRLHLLWVLARHPAPTPPPCPRCWPRVLVQLPLYNEATVAGRLIDAVCAMDYPGEWTIQVLDDSTDGTRGVVAAAVARGRAGGVDVAHLRRPVRVGFKAGALAWGLGRDEAPLVAIFDADFVPDAGFLRRMVPWVVERPEVGLAQARWGHLNAGENVLTRLQAVALDAHFRVEQAARSRSGRFFNFNGTAGIWRREAIEAAGGWEADTITEDLDLSLRAQLCGWRFVYVDDEVVPAELPSGWSAFRAQQRRWTRGSAQTARKLLGPVWSAPEVPLRARLEATWQLILNAAYPLLLALSVLSVPLGVWGAPAVGWWPWAQWSLFGLATGAVGVFYVAARRGQGVRALLDAAVCVPALFACGVGLSVSNARAFLAGLGGGSAVFVRTPKAGDAGGAYRAVADAGWAEGVLAAFALWGLVGSAGAGRWSAWPFLWLIVWGFGGAAIATWRDRLRGGSGGIPAAEPGAASVVSSIETTP